jgi:hypothetical protein
MERIFADELAAHKNADASGLVFASQMATLSSSPSYLGESSKRSSQIDVPLVKARRQHMINRALQAAAAVMLLVAGGVFVWWKTKPPTTSPPVVAQPTPAPVAAPPAPAPPAAVAAPTTAAAVVPAPAAPAVAPPTAPTAPVAAAAVVPTAAPTAPLAPGVGPPRAKPLAKPGDAHITIASDPKCEVLVDGAPYGQTPLIDLAVPAGKHTIILLNSGAGIKETQKVTLSTGQLWTKSFHFEGGKVQVENGLSKKALLAGEGTSAKPEAVAATTASKEPSTKPRATEGAASSSKVDPAATPAPAPAPAPTPAVKTAVPAPAPASAPLATAPSAQPRTVASFVLDAQKVSGAPVTLPSHVQKPHAGQKVVGTYKICVNKDGGVYDVTTISSISGADSAITETLRTWKYKPQTGNVCATKVVAIQVPANP